MATKEELGRELRTHRTWQEARACGVCGIAYVAMDPQQLYCSAECRYRARANRQGRKARGHGGEKDGI